MLLISYKTSISNLSSFYGKISTPTRCYFVSHFKATTSAHIRSPQLSLHHTPTPTHTHKHTHTHTYTHTKSVEMDGDIFHQTGRLATPAPHEQEMVYVVLA